MDTRHYDYYAQAIDRLSTIYRRTRRFSEERRMYRLLLKTPEDKSRRRTDSDLKTLTRFSYLAEAELPCMWAFAGVSAFVLTLWTWRSWTVPDSLYFIYYAAAPLLIYWGCFSHKMQLWKALVFFILYMVISEVWSAQLSSDIPIYAAVWCYSLMFSPLVRPLYYEGLF